MFFCYTAIPNNQKGAHMKHQYVFSGTDPPNPSFRTRTARKNRQSDEVKGKTQISPEKS